MQPTTLATEEMALLWHAAAGATLHGPRCTCVGFGLLRRSRTELERDIAEFLIAKYGDKPKDAIVNLFQRWIDEHTPGCEGAKEKSGFAASGSDKTFRDKGLLQWIDHNAAPMGLTETDLHEICADIRTLLESMATPIEEFVCR